MVQILSWAKAARLRNMKIKKLIDNPTFKHYFLRHSRLSHILHFNAAIPWLQDANIARWETTNTSVVGLQPFNSPDMNTTVYALGGLSIKRGSYSGDFEWGSSYISTNPNYISYAGVVGSVIPLGANTSFPLITLVAVVDSHTTSYFIIREGDTNPARCDTKLLSDAGFVSQHYSYSTKGTYSIRPGLRVYVCQHFDNPTHSYNWARKFGAAVGIFIIVLELLKVLVIYTSSFYLLGFKQPGIVNFSNNSPGQALGVHLRHDRLCIQPPSAGLYDFSGGPRFNSVFVFIVPLLIGLAKLLMCVSIFWTWRFRKPLASPLMFSFALNSPILLLCTISSPVRQLATITAASGVTAWASWPFDFVAIDLPILVTLIMMKGFHYGNDQDVALLEQNLVLVILAIVFLVWRTVSGIWYAWISISVRMKSSSATSLEKHYLSSHTIVIVTQGEEGEAETLPFLVHGLRLATPPPNPMAFATTSPKILMVLGLVIYLCFDLIGSLALLASYYGPFSTRTVALYLNSPFLVLFYTSLGPHFRTKIITAARRHVHSLLLWKLRDVMLICSLLFIWPGFGFGYKPYGLDNEYNWWSWYGWGYDVTTESMRNDAEWHWSFFGLLSAIFGLIYCVYSILLNTVPLDMLDPYNGRA
ncbi:hypothetical protein BC936DRAFT_140505 [Jimgerdemannia flammicorona]|uniref:Uncharacterized protein n=1 Tax=Jimgerdemannia flammicorona TaxID=994334 RepID=A0A433DGZ3_9FUNG|nr:hypothetical protein BC936DRAFT_140505 [Jimgerdemannia flammicorona]